jgi:hypothetical protein
MRETEIMFGLLLFIMHILHGASEITLAIDEWSKTSQI